MGSACNDAVTLGLPTEILEVVFIHCAHGEHMCYSRITRIPPDWVNVSYVCRHWRNVAINCPTLWSYLFMASTRWTNVLLSRSMQASLKIRMDLRYGGWKLRDLGVLEPVTHHAERIQQLHLQLPRTYDDSVLDSFLSKLSSCAPRLEDLQISMDALPPAQISAFFDGGTPALRILELSGCATPWHSFNTSRLTTLTLRNAFPEGFQPDMVEVLSMLDSMQHLTHLHLEDTLASADGFLSTLELSPFQRIRLPHLSRLLIVAPVSTVIALMSCTDIPLKTQARIGCRYECGSSVDQYAPLSSLLPQRFSMSDSGIRSLDIEGAEWGRGVLILDTSFSAFERHSRSCMLHDWNPSVPLQVVIDFCPSMTRGHRNQVLSDICASLPLAHVQSARVLFPPSSPSFWTRALGHVRDLRSLKLSSGRLTNLSCIYSIFSLPPPKYDGTEDEDGLSYGPDPKRPGQWFPALEELELRGILFLAPSSVDWNVQNLYNALCTRKGSRGRESMAQYTMKQLGPFTELNMVWKWDGVERRIAIASQCIRGR